MLDPDFATQIDLNLAADPIAPLRFDVWDDDSGGKCHAASPRRSLRCQRPEAPQRRHNDIHNAGKKDPKKRDLIGRATFTKFAAREAAQTKVINADKHLYD